LKRVIRIAAAAAAFCGSITPWLAAKDVLVRVDPRIELVGIVFRLAGNPEYRMGLAESPYSRAVDRHFVRHGDHAAVGLAHELRASHGIRFDATASLAVHLRDAVTCELRTPLEPWPERLDRRWTKDSLTRFTAALRDFSEATDFLGFFEAQLPFHRATEARMRERIAASFDRDWLEKFFGGGGDATFLLHPAVLQGSHNYGVGVRFEDGREEISPLIGCWKYDDEGLPLFDDTVMPTIVHEFCHSFCNPIVDRHYASLAPSEAAIFPHVEERMRRQAYPTWRIVLGESLVRASVVRYVSAKQGSAAAKAQADDDARKGFLWIHDLVERYAAYEADRERYATLEDFTPEMVAFFAGYEVPRKERRDESQAPKVVRVDPSDGERDLDAATTTAIVVEFDRAMRTDAYSVIIVDGTFPPVDRERRTGFDREGKVFTLPIRVGAGQEYAFGLNGMGHEGFRSADGVPLAPLVVRFTTRAD
jgi:hypothetical protein